MVRDVVARAPTRIDFGGGWTDVPPYTIEQGGCVCNLAIDRHTVVRLRAREPGLEARSQVGAGEEPRGVSIDVDGRVREARSLDELAPDGAELAMAALRRARVTGIALEMRNDFPRGAGLGGSSAAGVALQAALAGWCGEQVDPATLAERSRAVETEELRIAGGSQDHYAAAFGGALALHFGERVSARRIPLSPELVQAIERRCIVVYTGQSRISGETITAVLDAYRARVPRVTQALARMRVLAEQMIEALERGSLDDLAGLVAEHWVHQRALHPKITTPLIEQVLEAAREASHGRAGGKALGASGGGSVLVIAPPDHVDDVRAAVERIAQPLAFAVDRVGACVSGIESGGA